MCKFHQDVALDVSRNADGTINPTVYALNIIALGANCSVRHYMPDMKGVKGSMTYRLASRDSQESFNQSGILYEREAFNSYRGHTLDFLQKQSQETIQQHGFDTHRPKVIKNRIKSFLQAAPDELYAPFGNLSAGIFKTGKDADAYQGLRLAAADYWQKDHVKDILTERFKQSVATIFTEAPQKTNPAMLKIYEAMPNKMKQFSECTSGICASAGGTLAGHFGCVAKFAVLPALGLGSGTAHDPVTMYGMMFGGTALGLGVWQYLHYRRGTLPGKLEKFVTYGTAIVGLGAVTAWHQLSDSHAHHKDHTPSPITYFNDQEGRRFMVRNELICGVRTINDTVINGVKTDLVLPYNTRRIDTLQISGIPQSRYPSITR